MRICVFCVRPNVWYSKADKIGKLIILCLKLSCCKRVVQTHTYGHINSCKSMVKNYVKLVASVIILHSCCKHSMLNCYMVKLVVMLKITPICCKTMAKCVTGVLCPAIYIIMVKMSICK